MPFKGPVYMEVGDPGRRGTCLDGVTRLSILSLISICSRLHDKWGDPTHERLYEQVDYPPKRVTSLT